MGHWQRKGLKTENWDTQELLPFHVKLNPRDWYTTHRPKSMDAECRIGQDCGGKIDFNPVLTHRLDYYGTYNRCVVQRRALKRMPSGLTDSNGEPTYVEFRQAYHPNGRHSGNFGKIDSHYDVVASFATKNEATEFRMMLERLR